MTDRTMLQFFKYNLILEALLAESAERESQLRQQLSAVDDQEFEWELEKEQLESRLDELSRQLRAQQAQADLLREEAHLSSERKRSLDAVRGMDEYPDTPEKIAAYFECHFADRLAFTERGRASLADCKTDPRILWDALYQMVTTLYELHTDASVTMVDRAFNERSAFRVARGEGTMTRRDSGLMRQFQDVYQGRPICIESHLKSNQNRESSPQFLRIYYCYDEVTHKLLIGSCGRHLDNYTTQKVH